MGIHDDIPHYDDIPPMPNDPHEWLDQALSRIAIEVECCQQHFSDGELAQIVLHLSSLVEGTRQTYTHAFTMMNDEEREAVLKVMIEIQTGQPIASIKHVAHSEDGDGYLIKLENVVVPDDLTELEGDGGQSE